MLNYRKNFSFFRAYPQIRNCLFNHSSVETHGRASLRDGATIINVPSCPNLALPDAERVIQGDDGVFVAVAINDELHVDLPQ